MDLISTDVPTIFTTSWCGFCTRLKSQLSRAGIEFREIDIDGNLTVPTVVFRDGSALTNPSVAQVGSRLSSLN